MTLAIFGVGLLLAVLLGVIVTLAVISHVADEMTAKMQIMLEDGEEQKWDD